MTRQVLRLDHVRHVIAEALGLTPGQRVVAIDGRQDVPDELWVTVDAGDGPVTNGGETGVSHGAATYPGVDVNAT